MREYGSNQMTDTEELDIPALLTWPEMADVLAEINDPRFGGRSHGSRATYAVKCRGPLCTKVEREKQRAKNERTARAAGRPYQASIHRKYDRDALLTAIIRWHKREMALRRLEARVS